MKGFFTEAELDKCRLPPPLLAQCDRCKLYKTCRSPKMPPSGAGGRKILLVAEAPGETEDFQGRQFVGVTGQYLREKLRKFGVSPDTDCWMTNALICRPPGNQIKDDRMVEWCRPNLLKTIKKLDPEIIVPLGGRSVGSLIGHLWKDDVGEISRWAGYRIPYARGNYWICPTFHPSFVMRAKREKFPVPEMMFERHLKEVAKLRGRPYDTPPDYASRVRVIMDTKEADNWINCIHERVADLNGNVAFDYENDTLKPDDPDARIVCCSLSDGVDTIAFPWQGAVVDRMKKLLRDPRVGKIASNLKHEHRWSSRKLGVEVRNWHRCTMTAAHILENANKARKITSIKFQAFVKLGCEDYDSHIKPFLKTSGGNEQNRIKEVNLPDLMLYCGLDSLLEYLVAEIQDKEFDRACRDE